MASISISSLKPYVPTPYPTISQSLNVYFTQQLRNIQIAIGTCQSVLRAGLLGVTPNAGVPTTSVLAVGNAGVFKDTSGGGVYLAYNDGGTIKKVALT